MRKTERIEKNSKSQIFLLKPEEMAGLSTTLHSEKCPYHRKPKKGFPDIFMPEWFPGRSHKPFKGFFKLKIGFQSFSKP